MSVCTSSSDGCGRSPASSRAATASSPCSIALLSSSVSTPAPQSATAHALERRTSYGQSRKSTPIELLSASNSGVGPAPNRPPQSLCVRFSPWGAAGAPTSMSVTETPWRDDSDAGELAHRDGLRIGQRRRSVARRVLGGQLPILDRTHARREGEEADEARRVALLVHVVLPEGDEALVVQRVHALSADHGHRALVQAQGDGAGQTPLRDADERIVRLALGRPPPTLVDEIRVAGRDEILDQVDATDAVTSADRVERGDELDGAERLTIHRYRSALLETDHDVLGFVRRLRGLRGEHEHVGLRRRVRILEVAPLVAEMPKVRISRVDLLLGRGDRDATRRGVVDRVLAAADVPLTPRRDDWQVGCERREGHLEPDLVVPLAGAAMGECIGADAARDLDLPLGDERSRHRGAEQVLPVVY